MMSPGKRLKKLKKLFRSDSKDNYDLQPGQEITTAYVDLPKVSVNPLFIENEMEEYAIPRDFNGVEKSTR